MNHVEVPDDMADELRPEYDLSQLRPRGRGRYAAAYRETFGVVRIDPELLREFPDDASVNAALREYLRDRRPKALAETAS